MKADIAITNGLLVDSKAVWPGVLYIKEGKIIGITQSLENRPSEVIDASGLYILPGAIDGHVHMMDPGYTDREDFTKGTRAAARGGVTTVIDHHRTKPQVFGAKELLEKKEYLKTRSVVDFGLLGGLSLTNLANLKGLWEEGALGFKGFTCELHEAEALGMGNLMEILSEIRKFDGIALFHCEDDSLLKKAEERLRKEGRKDRLTVSEWRSPEAEEVAVRNLIYAAKKTGARVAVAHTSLPCSRPRPGRSQGPGSFRLYGDMSSISLLNRGGPGVKRTVCQVHSAAAQKGRGERDGAVPGSRPDRYGQLRSLPLPPLRKGGRAGRHLASPFRHPRSRDSDRHFVGWRCRRKVDTLSGGRGTKRETCHDLWTSRTERILAGGQ